MAGTYHVVATTQDGCKSEDNLPVTNLLIKPVVNLNKDLAPVKAGKIP